MSASKDSSSFISSLTSWWGGSSTPSEPAAVAPAENLKPDETPAAKRARLAKRKMDQLESTLAGPKVNIRLLQDLCTTGSQVQLLESPHHPKYTILALFALSYPIRTSMEINSLKLLFLPNRYSRDAWFAPEVLACALFCPLLDETLYPVYHMTTRHYGTHFWHVLLGVLPLETSKWQDTLAKNQELWCGFVQDLVINPRDEYNKSMGRNGGLGEGGVLEARESEEKVEHDPLSAADISDHPLSLDRKSTWNAYFKDCELQAEIKKDVSRTFPTLHFFRQGDDPHLESLERILFIWCKLNPGVSYVQGMNEVLGPLYYLFAISPANQNSRASAESQAFFCFMNLMSEIMNNFIKTLDVSEMGIVHQISLLSQLLQEKDPQLWKDLEKKKLNLQFFAFRQLTLLLSQEFELPDVLRLWDTLFSDSNRFELLRFCCCSMLMLQRDTLLRGDFSENLKLMQSYPPTDIENIINYALELATNTELEVPFLDLDEGSTHSNSAAETSM